jgi:EAL domain-containing protein (putative c-di-GMP-specific phosphodiesterase class I)
MEHCSLEQAERVAHAMRAALEGFRFLWDKKTFSIGLSIGLVPGTETGEGISGVVRAADTACYAAKENGGNRIHVYREDDPELAQRHGVTQWVARINRALEEGRFCLYFQPIRPVVSSEMQGAHYEALLRMKDEEGQIVLPSAFLPAAERYDLATKLDGWVIHAMFEWLICHREHLEQLYLCEINLSGHSLGNDEFLRTVIREFDETNIPAEKICFEVTETAAIANLTRATHFIQTLKARGCRFALDDFGSGLSSFAYLKNFPVDFLKIDGVFVKNIVNDPTDLAMVKSINEIGHTMGKRTIAEFVESAAILRKLKLPEIGVDFAQGYHIGRPRPIGDML